MGLGSINDLTLAEARERARLCRQQLARRHRSAGSQAREEAIAAAATARMVTFKAEAEAFIEANRAGWKNGKHADHVDQHRADDLRLPAHRPPNGGR